MPQGFFAQVYALVAGIPPGTVMTYGQIALLLGRPRAAKAVGTAMRCTPPALGLPCHRVVNRLGEMAPSDVFGAQALQRALLRSEGVRFLPNGRIDMACCLWSPPAQALARAQAGEAHASQPIDAQETSL